jgi:hypothetical protein
VSGVAGPSGSRWTRVGVSVAALAACTLLASGGVVAAATHERAAGTSSAAGAHATAYPVGVFDLDEPSYLAPPPPWAMPGYTRTYVNDFTQPLPRPQWFLYRGVPQGDPAGRFDPQHVAVNHGMLKIGTWRDPRYANHWVSGGAGLGGLSITDGAFFVRSRETVAGPDDVALLWPTDNQWPPEIDIDEAYGSPTHELWFVHYDQPQDQDVGHVTIDVTHWHTWGVIWTPQSITFTVDGRVWGSVTSPAEIPTIPMELGLQSQAWCGITGEPCPTAPSTYLIDWVAVYQPT